ncbi:hypothetical protein ACPPVS_08990 [Cellulomonas sp. McL0617]|uniref:hypothetical protein n=1 Tax=Cellulomonas sp. McL0617 TaxID=3415675 RepID=UPI003CF593BF
MSGFGPALHAEWTKARTLASTWWLLAFVVVSMVGLAAAITGTLDTDACSGTCDTVKLSLTGVRLAQAGVAALAVLVVSSEYATETITTTLAAVPRRSVVVCAKLVLVSASTLVAGGVGVLAAVVVGRGLLAGRGFTAASGYPDAGFDALATRAAVGTVVYLVLVAVLSAGTALIVRDTAAAVTIVLAALFVAPLLAMAVDADWQDRIHRFAPMDAGLAVQATRDLGALHIGAWPGLALLGGYALVAALLGGLALISRDA